MKELIITNEMRSKINKYLGYELIKKNEVGHHIYDEAPGLGRIGIEGNEFGHVVTHKQLDSSGNIEWHKSPTPKAKIGEVKPFHCKLTTVSSKKAKILIASLFPEEAVDQHFLDDNLDTINTLRKQLHLLKNNKALDFKYQKMIMGPNDMFLESALYYYYGEKTLEGFGPMMYGPNEMLF